MTSSQYSINYHAHLLATREANPPRLDLPLQDVAAINELVGNKFNGDFKALKKQISIIQSELNEALESASIGNMEGMQDDNMDLFFTVTGLLWRAGTYLNAHNVANGVDSDWSAVINSQWSKFDTSAEEWAKTEAKYQAYGMAVKCVVKNYNGQDYYITLSAKDQLDEKARHCSEGKWLKSYRFKDVTLGALPTIVSDKSSYVIAFKEAIVAAKYNALSTTDAIVNRSAEAANISLFNFGMDSRYAAAVSECTYESLSRKLTMTFTYTDLETDKVILTKTLSETI